MKPKDKEAPASVRRSRRDPMGLLRDPKTAAMTAAQAADLLGISRNTASVHYRSTGYLIEGVRVYRVGRRCVVACADLRRVLGLPEPIET